MIALLKCTLRTAVVTETRQRKMSSISSRQTLNRIFITFDTLMSQDTEKNKRIITRFEEWPFMSVSMQILILIWQISLPYFIQYNGNSIWKKKKTRKWSLSIGWSHNLVRKKSPTEMHNEELYVRCNKGLYMRNLIQNEVSKEKAGSKILWEWVVK